MPVIVLSYGSRGSEVVALQKMLVAKGHSIAIDGIYGNGTAIAVRAYQRNAGLVDDGMAGPKTIQSLTEVGGKLPDDRIIKTARRLNVEPAAVYAVVQIESRGNAFFAPGKPAILYERHIMRRRLLRAGIAIKESMPADLVNTKSGGYLGGLAEYRRLEAAIKIHEESALESCSWGAFQIMGYHWEFLGYKSIHDFVGRIKSGEDEHFEALARFIEKNPNLHIALQRHDWAAFGKGYNGKDYWKSGYHHKLERAYSGYRGSSDHG